MATLNGILTQFLRGKIGEGSIVYERLGTIVMRSCPGGAGPKGEKQIAQQKRLAGSTALYQEVKRKGLASGWRQAKRPPGWSGYNLFMHRNMRAFSGGGELLAPEKVQLTAGEGVPLPDALHLQRILPAAEGEERWRVEWTERTEYPGGQGTDRAVVALMRGGRFLRLRFAGTERMFRRQDGMMEFSQPDKSQEYVHCYVFFASEDGKRMSASRYLGVLL